MSRLSKSQLGRKLSMNSANSKAFVTFAVLAVSMRCHDETTTVNEPDSSVSSSFFEIQACEPCALAREEHSGRDMSAA
jgi:hypothetical protein